MSDNASIIPGGEWFSAIEYRQRYLTTGEVHQAFYCPNPSCAIRIASRLIYIDGKGSRTPHFYVKWDRHKDNCDGEPVETDRPIVEPPKAHYIKGELEYPKVLIDRPRPRVYRQGAEDRDGTGKASREVEAPGLRRRRTLGKAAPRAYHLRTFVETRLSVMTDGYRQQKLEGWDDKKRNEWLKTTLSAMELNLKAHTDYEDGFRTPRFINWRQPRIYHGAGTVIFDRDHVVINAALAARGKDGEKPFKVVVALRLLASDAPRLHVVVLKELKKYSSEGNSFRWYAFGSPVELEDEVILQIASLDHIYIRPPSQKH